MRPIQKQPAQRTAGFSLVELMVSVVIGLLALLFATRLIVSGEQNKAAAVGGSDSMQNGMLALFSLSNDAAESGWGLNDTLVAGCNAAFSDASGYQLATASRNGLSITPLAAVVIQDNGALPDQVSFYSGTSAAGVGSVKLTANYAGGNTLTTDTQSPYGFNNGDVLLVAAMPDLALPCSVVQLSGVGATANTSNQLILSPGGSNRYNQSSGMATSYPVNQTYIYNLGNPNTLHFHTWSVRNGILLLRATEMAGASAQAVSVVDNVVSLKAQYGFDTRVINNYNPNPGANGMQVTQWSSTMIDADSDGDSGGPGDYQRIAAVRLAVVARSKNAEKPNASGQCSATTVQPQVFQVNAPATVAAVPLTVNVAVSGDPVNWQCYRYRVFETIVPIRNSQWRP